MKFNLRQSLLGMALVLTVGGSIYSQFDDTPQEASEIIEPVRRVKSTNNGLVPNTSSGPISKLHRLPWVISTTEINVFPGIVEKRPDDSFKISLPVVEQVITPSPVPTAPPLPFTYLGKMVDGAAITIFVSQNSRNLALKGGEVIDGIYKVKSIDSQRVVFEYTPLKEEQILLIRG